jgi:acyl-CoA synthetase (AMP-forming)/AMP-acid ligase II
MRPIAAASREASNRPRNWCALHHRREIVQNETRTQHTGRFSEHPAVLMVAVIGAPDPIRGEIVKALIVPRPGVAAGPELAAEIQSFVRERLAAYQYPRAVEFLDSLPMTATGKILRRELRDRETRR